MLNNHIRKGRKYSVDEILPILVRNDPPYKSSKRHCVEIDGDPINIKSSRLATFKTSGTKCVCCGVEGRYFVKEKHVQHKNVKKPLRFHINLYAIDNQDNEVLMTSDHIVPHCKRSGAKNNRQTMCSRCNQLKADREISLEDLRKELQEKCVTEL